jgi:C-terminal peptidase prc
MERRNSRRIQLTGRALACCMLVLLLFAPSHSQDSAWTVEQARKYGFRMLTVIKDQIERTYFDKTFHGLNLDARFKLAEEKIAKAQSSGQVLGIIAQAVLDLNDSHTQFIPPLGASVAVYGWKMQMIGDGCYITAVMPGSDAEAKGLTPGDRVTDVDGYEPTRDNLRKMQYYYYSLRPQPRVKMSVRSPSGTDRTVEVITRSQKRKLEHSFGWIIERDPIEITADDGTRPLPQYVEFGEDLIVCRLPSFNVKDEDIDKVMSRIAGHETLILDLRGNGGGFITAILRFASYFFDREVKLNDLKMRDGTKEEKTKPRKKNSFSGKLIVLVDSRSASAAEIFARVVQLEKRGLVIGDHTSGMVMQSLHYSFDIGGPNKIILYGLTVTNADIIMTDGKSLEHVGVTPDELLLPTGADLKNRRDPVLARAASLAGVSLTPEKARDLFVQDAISK